MDLKYLIKEMKYYRKVHGEIRNVAIRFLFSRTPLKNVVNTRLYDLIYGEIIRKKSKKLRPDVLSIEITNKCNAKCIMCPHSKMKRKQQIMSQQNFEKIVDNIMKTEKIKFIIFSGLGEPLIDRDLERKIKFINKKYGIKIVLFTNSSLLTNERSKKLLGLDILKINFSLNGTKKDYGRIMGLDYENAIRNMEYFLKRKKELGKEFPLTNISLMILNEDERELNYLKKFWREKVDSVTTYNPSDWGGDLKSKDFNKNYKTKRWPCINLWKDIYVNSNGDVVKCNADYESLASLGNLIDTDYSEIKQKLNEIKKRHLKGDFVMPICENCGNSSEASLGWLGVK